MTRRSEPERRTGGSVGNPASLANLRPNPANLIPGGTNPAGEGNARALASGARTVRPQGSPEWSPAVALSMTDLAARVGDELRGPDGEPWPWAVPSIEAVAVLRVALARVERWAADREARGTYTGDDDERVAKIADRYHRALEREALTLRSRIEARAASVSLAQAMSAVAEPADVAEGETHDGA